MCLSTSRDADYHKAIQIVHHETRTTWTPKNVCAVIVQYIILGQTGWVDWRTDRWRELVTLGYRLNGLVIQGPTLHLWCQFINELKLNEHTSYNVKTIPLTLSEPACRLVCSNVHLTFSELVKWLQRASNEMRLRLKNIFHKTTWELLVQSTAVLQSKSCFILIFIFWFSPQDSRLRENTAQQVTREI